MSKTIYAVMFSHYGGSNEHVEALFSTKPKAQAYINTFLHYGDRAYGDRAIEEFELNPEGLKRGAGDYWRIELNRDGVVLEAEPSHYIEHGEDEVMNFHISRHNKTEGALTLIMFHRSLQDAINIAQEKRRVLIAENIWVETVEKTWDNIKEWEKFTGFDIKFIDTDFDYNKMKNEESLRLL